MPDKLITEKDAATLFGLSVSWFQRKRWAGGGPPFIKFDRAVRYRETELNAWINARSGHELASEHSISDPHNAPSSKQALRATFQAPNPKTGG